MGNVFSLPLLSRISRKAKIALAISMFVVATYLKNRRPSVPIIQSNYDYIIVGAGSAGCVIANRLSDNPNTTVLLIEAGGNDDNKNIKVPLACNELQRTDLDWQYTTTPQKYACKGMREGRSKWPRGKMLGGCSSMNYMLYVRGNKADYDHWEQLGCTGWSYKDVLPYFLKSEGHTSPGPAFDNQKYHSRTGPLSVSDLVSPNDVAKVFVEAANDCGVVSNPDYNGASQLGASLSQLTQINGERCSSSRAFLDSKTRQRKNLTILTACQVTKVLFNSQKEAIGVTYQYQGDGDVHTVHVKKEVILAAGAIGTPHLLLLSGVGPSEHLKQHNIPVVSDLPGVGHNLQDHIMCGVVYTSKVPTITKRSIGLWVILNYMFFRKGLLTSNGLEATAFIQTGVRPDLPSSPDCQLHFFAGSGDQTDQDNFGTLPKFQQSPDDKRQGFCCFSTLLRPKSTGTITLTSSSPFDSPAIDPNYLHHDDDVKTLREGLRVSRRILTSKRFDSIRGLAPRSGFHRESPYSHEFPMHDAMSNKDVDDWSDDCYEWLIRHTAATVYHPAGTAKMGPRSDHMAVVDHTLRVYGVSGVRCADASIMPTIVSGNTNAPCIMIGEKASDLLKCSYQAGRSKL